MVINKVAILLGLFIFGITAQVRADLVKSINNAANQETIMKMDENKVVMQKKQGPPKEPINSLKKTKARFPSDISYSDYGAIMDGNKLDVNFLKTLEERKKPRLTDSLNKVIYSFQFSRDAWKDKFLTFREVTETRSPNSDFGQSILKPYPNGNKYFEEGRIPATYKLLQSKREELFKEIFMGFRFSFAPMSGHLFLEMNVTPSSEIGPGIIIPFWK